MLARTEGGDYGRGVALPEWKGVWDFGDFDVSLFVAAVAGRFTRRPSRVARG